MNGKGVIIIKLVDSKGKEIKTSGKVNCTVTDSNGNYKWQCKSYNNGIRLKYDAGSYNVKVKFFGDKKYKSASESQYVTLQSVSSGTDWYNYYDNNQWGLNQKIDDYIEYNYWDEEIYDDASNYDGEGY